jgi:hypothetical protein
VSIAYLAEEVGGALRSGGDAEAVKCFRELPPKLAFDHKKILSDALSLG